ncbi:MAG: hypothetical protein WCB52_21945, partial [Pseudolabrys sp.]
PGARHAGTAFCQKFNCGSAIAPGFNNHIAVRQPRLHAYGTTFGMVSIPPVVMTTVHVLAYYDVITIVDDNLRGHRDGADEHRPNGRA